MVAGTVEERIEGCPAFDIVKLTVNDGETYMTKLSRIVSVQATANSGGTACVASWAGGTVTIAGGAGGLPKNSTVTLTIAGFL
jgi:hypothetical protein